ncbi:MAG TPA: mechanosensitive ion channel domain-containing protein [Planctomycetota bacterium]|nr:mechanosensitive ion channel domain-containing protein [Planctomycetota bacterium]
MGAWLSKLWDKLLQDYFASFDVRAWAAFCHHVINSLLAFFLAWLLIRSAKFVIVRLERRVDLIHGSAHRRRIETITSLMFSVVKYALYFACLVWILGEWGVNTESLVVGTAVVGAALGFGCQGIVQDVITGLSMLAEGQLSVGDFVEINGKAGAVEEVGLRVIKIRDSFGVQHVIFNRTITVVSNFTSGRMAALVDVAVENAEAGEKAAIVAERVCHDIASELPFFPAAPIVEGVKSSSTGDVYVRISAVVLPKQDLVLRTSFSDRLRSAFAAAGIKIPGDRVRISFVSNLFKEAVDRGKRSGLFAAPAMPTKTGRGL